MKTLFDSTAIGEMKLKNRLWRSATWENMADEKGHLTDRLIQVYRNLARGGVGTIITGAGKIGKKRRVKHRHADCLWWLSDIV